LSKKKILIFIDWFSPGYKSGGPVRSCENLIDHLSDDFEFYIITRNTDYCDDTPYTQVESDQWNEFNNKAQIYYLSKKNCTIKSLKRIINDVEFDAAYINGIYSLFFSILPLYLLLNKKVNKIVAVRGMLAESAIKIKGTKKKAFLWIAKQVGLYKTVEFHATNEKEKLDIQKAFGNSSSVKIAANLPRLIKDKLVRKNNKKEGELRVISIARVAPEKNLLFALNILSSLSKGRIHFEVYGPKYDTEYWSACEKVISNLPKNVTVNYGGSLSGDHVLEELTKYDVLFLPTQGENFGHVILESLTVGTPVLISDQTPWRDLQKDGCGWDISLDQPERFQEVLKKLIPLNQKKMDEISLKASLKSSQFIDDKSIKRENYLLFI